MASEPTGWLKPVYKREQYDRLRTAVQEVIDDLKGAPCVFWACPGPDEPLTPMATCNVCATQIALRAALEGKEPAHA